MQSRNGGLADGISRRPLAGLSITCVSSKLPDRFLIFDIVARRRPRNQKSYFPQYLRNLIRQEAKIFRIDREPFGVLACRRRLVSDFYFRSDERPNFLTGPKRADLLPEFYFKICERDQRHCTKDERNCGLIYKPIIQVERFGRQGAPK